MSGLSPILTFGVVLCICVLVAFKLGYVLAERAVMRTLGDELDTEFNRGLQRGREERRRSEDETYRAGIDAGLRMPRKTDAQDGYRSPLIVMGRSESTDDRPIVILKGGAQK